MTGCLANLPEKTYIVGVIDEQEYEEEESYWGIVEISTSVEAYWWDRYGLSPMQILETMGFEMIHRVAESSELTTYALKHECFDRSMYFVPVLTDDVRNEDALPELDGFATELNFTHSDN